MPLAKAQTIDDYRALNDAETRLLDFKDDDWTLQLKVTQLQIINQSRKKHKAPPVALDILASRVANKMATEAVDGMFMGHFNLEGQWPWYRYALAGGTDHISENASAIRSSDDLATGEDDLLSYMEKMHRAFMAEKKPNDGHKQNCIDKHHTHVGLGLAIEGGEFRYYEVFVDSYLQIKPPVTSIKRGDSWSLSVKPLDASQHMWMCVVYHQPFPKKMSAKEASAIATYNDYGKSVFASLAPWDLPVIDAKGFTAFEFTFKEKGLYYVQIYLSDEPYTSGKVSSDGKTSASGVVVTVN